MYYETFIKIFSEAPRLHGRGIFPYASRLLLSGTPHRRPRPIIPGLTAGAFWCVGKTNVQLSIDRTLKNIDVEHVVSTKVMRVSCYCSVMAVP